MDLLHRNEALLGVIRQGLEYCNVQNTNTFLGDRSSYVGVSDIAKYLQCPRAAILGKTNDTVLSLGQLLMFQRGHWFEAGLGEALSSIGLKFIPQLEISIKYKGTPIKAHLDFTLVWNKPYPAIRILEIKSMDKIPVAPYEAHENQIQTQVSILYKYWNKKVFGVRDKNGSVLFEKLTFPQICQECLNVPVSHNPDKVSVEGWLLCLSMKNAQAFGPYVHDSDYMENSMNMASNYWEQYKELKNGSISAESLVHSSGFNPLCQYCQFNGECPNFSQSEYQPQWEDALDQLADLKKNRTSLDYQIKELETAIRQAHDNSGVNTWVETGSHRFRITNTAGRKTIDSNRLQNELKEIFADAEMDDIDVDALICRCTKVSEPSSRLTIMPIN